MPIYANRLLKGVDTSLIPADAKGRIWFSIDNKRTGCQVAIDTTVTDLREFAMKLLHDCNAIEESQGNVSMTRGNTRNVRDQFVVTAKSVAIDAIAVKVESGCTTTADVRDPLSTLISKPATYDSSPPVSVSPIVIKVQRSDALQSRCRSNRDGECNASACPQKRDNEPMATGRSCPLPELPYDDSDQQ